MRFRKAVIAGLGVIVALGLALVALRNDADWTVRARAFRCSAIGDGATEVDAVSRVTGEDAPIISFWEITDVKLRADSPHRITVILDNDVRIKDIHDSFEGIAIVYDYQPKNDPEARAWSLFSLKHWDDPRVRAARQATP